jgi:hypothetical protein
MIAAAWVAGVLVVTGLAWEALTHNDLGRVDVSQQAAPVCMNQRTVQPSQAEPGLTVDP